MYKFARCVWHYLGSRCNVAAKTFAKNCTYFVNALLLLLSLTVKNESENVLA